MLNWCEKYTIDPDTIIAEFEDLLENSNETQTHHTVNTPGQISPDTSPRGVTSELIVIPRECLTEL